MRGCNLKPLFSLNFYENKELKIRNKYWIHYVGCMHAY